MSGIETSKARMVRGRIVSDRMDKTVTVLIERKVKHPLYGKVVRRSTKFHAHDEANEGRIGDRVVIQQTRPISKLKSWKLVTIEK